MTTPGQENLSDIKRELLRLRLQQQETAQAQRDQIPVVPRTGALAVAEQQRSLWFLHQLTPDSPAYNVPFAVRLRGELDVTALRAALQGLVARHESLRTRFASERGVPYQIIDPAPATWPLPVTDSDGRDPQEWTGAESRIPIDLVQGPVFRSSLLRVSPHEHVLLLVMHHIVTDGWSVGRISEELAARYQSARSGGTVELPELAVQPADHAAWQRQRLTGGEIKGHLDYWRSALDGAEELDFPSDRPRPTEPSSVGAIVESTLPASLADAARTLAQQEQVSLMAVLYAAFLMVLRRHTGQRDLTIGSVFSGRARPEIEPLVGFFANTVVLRTSVAGNPAFKELARRCNDTVLNGQTHQDAPFGMVVDALQPDRTPGRNPLFQVMFTMLTSGIAGAFRFGDLDVEQLTPQTGTARFDLTLQVTDTPGRDLGIWVEFSTALFDHDRIHRLISHFQTVLSQAVVAPTAPIDSFELLPQAERAAVLREWNPAPTPRPGGLLHEYVARHAAEHPERVAMRFGDDELTYRELATRSDALAKLLTEELKVAPGQVVAVLLERGLGLPVAQLGALKAGAAWLPLDPQYPDARLEFQVGDAPAAAVVTTSDLAARLPADVPRLCLDDPDLPPLDLGAGADWSAAAVHPEQTAYVIYTSGSTGAPKGVMVPHRAAVAFCENVVELFSITYADRVLQFSNPAFDVSIMDFYGAFAGGATVVGAPRSTLLDPDALQVFMRREQITIVDIPPAVLQLLDPDALPELRILWVGMEPYPADLVNRWTSQTRQFHNGYGPTEATVTCVNYRCPDEPLHAAPPIGQAMPNHRAYVLDAALRPTPIGVPGELFLAGAGLAQGYLRRPELTAGSFLPDPYADRPSERMYRTGDLVRWRADGNLEFLGRADRQIKIRGLRIELGEIEHALNSHPDTRQAAVVVKQPGTPKARLIGYVVPEPERHLDDGELRAYLAERLPLHMVPSAVLSLPELPLTANNKLDEARLPEPESASASEPASPQSDVERQLAGIWSRLLDIADDLDRHANFFDLGGNSLQATQLISRIRDTFDVTLHPRQLFTYPVLSQLAAEIERNAGTPAAVDMGTAIDEASPLVPINAAGARVPFFCVHAGAGSVTPYAGLAQLLGADQPFYGLEDPGLHGDTSAERLTDAASRYLAAIREVQPVGPYRLGGWSVGGGIALEMAQQLRESGEEASVVVLIDANLPPGHPQPPEQSELLVSFLGDVAGIASAEPVPVTQESLRRLSEDEQIETALEALDTAGLIPDGLRVQMAARMLAFIANSRAFWTHQPEPYHGRLVSLWATHGTGDDLPGWQALAPNLVHHEVPGDHYSMLRPPHLAVLAEHLRRALDETPGGDQ
ncbi:MAG: non-ribosomal peptide synthetase [Micromonosporaceae bacterium]